jgi:hypothetical protein
LPLATLANPRHRRLLSTKHRGDEDEFWERMLAFENGPFTTNFDQLIKAGVELPAPEQLDDLQLHRTLWNAILALAVAQ